MILLILNSDGKHVCDISFLWPSFSRRRVRPGVSAVGGLDPPAAPAGEALMHVLRFPRCDDDHVLILATGDGNLGGQAPNTAAGEEETRRKRRRHWDDDG